MGLRDDDQRFRTAWQAWHDSLEVSRARPHGYLAVTGLHWLDEQPTRFGDVPGVWSSHRHGVRVRLDSDEEFLIDDQPVVGAYDFGVVADVTARYAAFGEAVVEVTSRNGRALLRPRHPDHAPRLAYAGTPTYPPTRRWALLGHYVALDAPRTLHVEVNIEGLEHQFQSSGSIELVLDGTTRRLTVFDEESTPELYLLFLDGTSGDTTYPGGRQLTIDAPVEGVVTVDFNRANNLPCAYSSYTTCPLPPPENRLAVRVEAGEMMARA